MLNCTFAEREKQLQDLHNFTERVHNDILDITSTLNWTVTSLAKNRDDLLICPCDSSHRVSEEAFDQHLACCQWKAEGYREFNIPLSEPGSSSHASTSIKLDAKLQNDILRNAKEKDPAMKIGLGERLIPRTSNRLVTDFTSDERRALYDYVISNTKKADIGHDITDIHTLKSQDKEDKELSFLELLVQERNLKRRRAKHRGVHTNKKSHTEILREVINQQMELYVDYIGDTREIDHSKDSEMAFGGNVENPPQSFKESFTSRPNIPLKDTHEYLTPTRSQSKDRNERSSDGHSVRPRDHKKRDKYSSKDHKRHKHRKRSRSNDRKSHKEDKHRAKYSSHKKHTHKSREQDVSFDNYYSKHNGDRRDNRDRR